MSRPLRKIDGVLKFSKIEKIMGFQKYLEVTVTLWAGSYAKEPDKSNDMNRNRVRDTVFEI